MSSSITRDDGPSKKSPYFLLSFEQPIRAEIQKVYSHLWLENEHAILDEYSNLTVHAKTLLARLIPRSAPHVYSKSDLIRSYSRDFESLDILIAAINDLDTHGFAALLNDKESYQKFSSQNIFSILRKPQLKRLFTTKQIPDGQNIFKKLGHKKPLVRWLQNAVNSSHQVNWLTGKTLKDLVLLGFQKTLMEEFDDSAILAVKSDTVLLFRRLHLLNHLASLSDINGQ